MAHKRKATRRSNLKPGRKSLLGFLNKAVAEDTKSGRKPCKNEDPHTTGDTSIENWGGQSRPYLFNFSSGGNRGRSKSSLAERSQRTIEDERELVVPSSSPGGETKEGDNDPPASSQGTRKGKGKAVDHDSISARIENLELKEKTTSPDSSISNRPPWQGEEKASGHNYSSSSKDATDNENGQSTGSQSSASTPPTMEDIDRWNYHTNLQRFGENLQLAANAVFPNEKISRYTRVSVLMLNWEDEDPNLPVSIEIDKLASIFSDTYYFEVIRWKIPDENCHFRLAETVMEFVRPNQDSTGHLKIVYYAGHAKLLDTRALALTSWRNKDKSKCPMVKWGAIQSFIEESPSDALILLDCCASGTANASEGNGVTEVISACAWNQIANGVGPYSLTSALSIELERLSNRASFSIGELYRNVYLRTQSWMPEAITSDGRNVERHPAPIHLVLTQDSKKPRSIQLSVQPSSRLRNRDYSSLSSQYERISAKLEELDRDPSERKPPEKFPRLAFAVRLSESFLPSENIEKLLLEWLRDLPLIAEEVKIEAGFDSFSTLLILSIPFSLSAYMPFDPAVVPLGPIKSENRLNLNPFRLRLPLPERTPSTYKFDLKRRLPPFVPARKDFEQKELLSSETQRLKTLDESIPYHQWSATPAIPAASRVLDT